MKTWRDARSEYEDKVISFPVAEDDPIQGWDRFCCALFDQQRALKLFVELPHRLDNPSQFFVTFIGDHYYAFWPDSEMLYQCHVHT